MRASTWPVSASLLLALACAEPRDAAPRAEASRPAEPAPPVPREAPTIEPVGEEPAVVEPDEAAAAPAEPMDPLAPILPSGPEPGSPEADAELAELLEESTLTQDEFDAAFRGSKPKLDGDQFVFGPGERTRKRPSVGVGTPVVTESKVAASEFSKLAFADMRELEGCLAVALVDDPGLDGAVTLSLSFDADGEVGEAHVVAESGAVMAPLRVCLATAAEDWSLPAAAGAEVEMILFLRGE